MASLSKRPLSEEEYLRVERQAETKSEFHNGEMFAMAGGSPNHSLLANNIGALLKSYVPAGCRAFNADLRIAIPAASMYTYADCSVVCGDLQLSSDQQDNVLNPVLIVAVLSPSTEGYDRGKKFELYRSIASFREYLLVQQDRPHVEHYSKQDDGAWLLREYAGLASAVNISRLDVRLPLSEIFAGVVNTAA